MSTTWKKLAILFFALLLIGKGLYTYTNGFNFSTTKCCEDVLFNNFVMEHTFNAFFNPHYKGNLVNTLVFYPTIFSIGRSDNLLGTAGIYYIFRVFTDPLHSFLFWACTMFILDFGSFYFFLRKFGISWYIALVGAYIFAFSSAVLFHTIHPQLLPKFWFPWVLYYLLEYLEKKQLKALKLCLFLAFAQLASGIYLGFFAILCCAIILIIFVLSNRKNQFAYYPPKYVFSVGAVITVFMLVVSFFMIPYLYHALIKGVYYIQLAILESTPTLASYMYSGTYTIFGRLTYSLVSGYITTRPHEHLISLNFTGIVFLGLLCVGLSKKLYRTTKLQNLLVLLITICLLSFNFGHKITLWSAIYYLPGMSAIRAVARLFIVIQMLATLLSLVSLEFLFTKIRHRTIKIGLALFFAIFVLVDQHTTGLDFQSIAQVQTDIQKVQKQIPKTCDVAYTYATKDLIPKYTYYTTISMLAATTSNTYLYNGYSGVVYGGEMQNHTTKYMEIMFPTKNVCRISFLEL
jgi:hypothetical protein